MARVVVAKEAGSCYGVERALGIVEELAVTAKEPVCTLGPLIHNPVVVSSLEEQGTMVVSDPADAPAGSQLVMRTHGVAPEVEKRAHEAGLKVVDATCPYVKRVHVAVERLRREGYQVVVVGEQGHPEVEGTIGHAPGSLVLGNADEARFAKLEPRVGVVVQTTLDRAVLHEVVEVLVDRCREVRVINTICNATSERQRAAAELAREADVMIVVGGRSSANTTHLASICAATCARTHHIERAEELEGAWLAGAGLVGVTAGASTPASHIREAVDRIERLLP